MDVIAARRSAKKRAKKKNPAVKPRRSRSPTSIRAFSHTAFCICLQCLRHCSAREIGARALALQISRRGYIVEVVDRNALREPVAAKSYPLPIYAYTVGLGFRYELPELLIVGQDGELMQRVLRAIADRARDEPKWLQRMHRFVDTIEIDESEMVFFGCAVLRPRHLRMLERAFDIHELGRFTARQIVLADKNGRVPWNDKYETEFPRSLIELYDSSDEDLPDWSSDSDSSDDDGD